MPKMGGISQDFVWISSMTVQILGVLPKPKHVLHAVAFYILGALVSMTTYSVRDGGGKGKPSKGK